MSRYGIIIPSDAPVWAQRLQAQLSNVLRRIATDMRPKLRAKATLPADGSERLAIVTDEAGGEVLAYLGSDGQWRRVTDNAVVS